MFGVIVGLTVSVENGVENYGVTVGVDSRGRIVGEEATLSYACNDGRVVQECKRLKKCVTFILCLGRDHNLMTRVLFDLRLVPCY